MNYLPQNLKYLRVYKKFTQQALAEACSDYLGEDHLGRLVSRASISSYEDRRAEPSIRVLIAFSEVLEVNMEVLVKSKDIEREMWLCELQKELEQAKCEMKSQATWAIDLMYQSQVIGIEKEVWA